MKVFILAVLCISPAALAAPPTIANCGNNPELAGIVEGRQATDQEGSITTGTGDPTTCELVFDVINRRACVVRWPAQAPFMPRGTYRVDNTVEYKIIIKQAPRSGAKITYQCKILPG